MPIELKVPAMGESITEIQIGSWRKAEGEWAAQDEVVVELETDKTALEIPAPVAGTVVKHVKRTGEKATIGDVIGYLEAAPAPTAKAESPATRERPANEKGEPPRSDPRVMPAAQRVLGQAGVKPAEVVGTGPGGRILKEDAWRHLEQTKSSPPRAERGSASAREEDIVPMSLIRRRIADRLVEAQKTAALLTTFNEIDMSTVQALRAEYREAFQAKYQVKLGFMSFFVKAVIDALRSVPSLNAEIRGDDIVYRNYYDIGIAVGGGKGLVVPILRNAERMSFAEIELAIADFARRAQQNRLSVDELTGGTFSITNGGIYGSLLSTPIVNPPQSGILGMHAIQDRPVAIEGKVVVRPMMYVALTYDHRLVDGREAVGFLRRVKDVLETPARMLLEI